MSETCLGLFVDGWRFTKVRQAMRTQRTQSRSMLCVVRNSCVRDLRHIAGGQGRYLPEDTGPIRKFDSHSREPRSWRTIITG